MIKIRKHLDVRQSLHISSMGLKLPEDFSWVGLSPRYSLDEIAEARDLKTAFELGLIEVEITGDYQDAPNWYIDAFVDNVRVPEEILDKTEQKAVECIARLRKDAHPIVWTIVRPRLYMAELFHGNRPEVLESLS